MGRSYIWFFATIVGALASCNRVPDEPIKIEPPELPPVLIGQLPPEALGTAEQRSLAELCDAACHHWAKLRFLEPIGYDQLNPGQQSIADEILTRQRQINGEECKLACTKRDDRERASCFLGLQAIAMADSCTSPDPTSPRTVRGEDPRGERLRAVQ